MAIVWSCDEKGWVTPARHRFSPHFNERPRGIEIDLLVIHGISLPAGVFGTPHIEQLFMNNLDIMAHPDFPVLAQNPVSAHFVIDREGLLTQYVSLQDRAWHAGVSHFKGRENCNDFSIGIELEGTDTLSYTDAQYEQLIALTRLLQQQYPRITREHIVGHSDIAPARKTDPGLAFDWKRYLAVF